LDHYKAVCLISLAMNDGMPAQFAASKDATQNLDASDGARTPR